MLPTKVSIRLAIKKIAEMTCGVRPKSIPVTISGDPTNPVFSVSIPFENKVEVYSYLAEHLGLHRPIDRGPLTLTPAEASAIVEFVVKQTRCEHRSVVKSSADYHGNAAEEPLLDTPQA